MLISRNMSTWFGVATALAIAASAAMPAAAGQPTQDAWKHVDQYAPIVQFNGWTVHHFPQSFPGDNAQGQCAYVNVVQQGDTWTFQYWLYYAKDVRISADVDQGLKRIATDMTNAVQRTLSGHRVAEEQVRQIVQPLNDAIGKLIHEHDWELISVDVSRLGDRPSAVSYFAHGLQLRIHTDPARPGCAPMDGFHPIAKVLSDMHGTYPGGTWGPVDLLNPWPDAAVAAEFGVAFAFETAERLGRGDLQAQAPYTPVSFAGCCRPISDQMRRVTELPPPGSYPYLMPWDPRRAFRY